MFKKYSWLIPILLIIVFAIFIHSRLLGLFADADSFYHIKHSWIYRTGGIFQTAFPWAQYSVINQYSADLWYGFHILIIPLTLFSDLLKGIALGEVLTAIISLLLVFWAFQRLKLKYALFWTFFFALATADLLYRLNMLRPHPLSLGLSLLLFSYLVTMGYTEKDARLHSPSFTIYYLLFTISFFISWIHLSLSWLPAIIAFAVLLFEIIKRHNIEIRKYAALILGLVAGWLLRPNPFGALKLAYIQVAQLLVEKQSDLPLRFGRELQPFFLENFIDQHIPIFLFFTAALVFLLWAWKTKKIVLPEKLRTTILSSLVLTIVFAALTFGVARRSNEIMVGFAIIFIATLFSVWYQSRRPNQRKPEQNMMIIAAAILLIYMPLKTIYRFDTYATNAFPPLRFQAAAGWLKNNARPGEIIFNIQWDRFAEFFFWNHQNYYINGMDPIFEYAFDPSLYWKTHFLHIDAAGNITCGLIRCAAEEAAPTYEVLKDDFRASYIVVEKTRNPKVLQYLESSPKFDKVFEAPYDMVFKVL